MTQVTFKCINKFHNWQRSGNTFHNGFFANVVPNGEDYIGACRYGAGNHYDHIHILHYDKDFNLTSRKDITSGEDPRTFIYKNKPYSVTWDPSPKGDKPEAQLQYKIIDLLDEKVIELDINSVHPHDTTRFLGKNWMPLVKDDELYIVLTIDPKPNILHCNLESAECTWVTPWDALDINSQITSSRGGTPFIYNKKLDKYIGFGHRTQSYANHKPFLYTLSKDFKTSSVGEDIITGSGLDHEDPLSIYEKDGKIYCCIGTLGNVTSEFSYIYEVTIE